MNADDDTPQCWCVYGTRGGGSENYGLEVVTPGCPTHDSQNTPAADDPRDREPCEICAGEDPDAWRECGHCDGSGEDWTGTACAACGGEGEVIIEHCCGCGGSPYCNCCTKCGAVCVADCRCPIQVQRHDGTVTLI
jgi:hypothetical protein